MSSVVPEGWKTGNLSDVSEKIWIGLVTTMTKFYVKSGVPLIRNSDITQTGINPSKLIHLENAFANENKSRAVHKGDVVTVHTGDIGTSSVIEDELDGAQGFATLNTRLRQSSFNPYFYSYVLNSEQFKLIAQKVVTGDGRSNLNLKDFVNLPITYPILVNEQKKIASILTSVDEVIENTQKQIDKLQDLKKATMNELLTKGIGHTEFKDSELGRIPKSWEVGALSNLITIKHGYAFEGAFFTSTPNGITLLTPGNFHRDGHLYFGSKTKYYTGEIPKDYILSNGDLLVVMTDLTAEMTILGNTLILSATNIILHNQRIGKIAFSDEDFHLGFLNLIMNSRYVKQFVKLTATGTTVRHTSPTKIMDCDVPIPSLSEQTRIASIISCIQENIEKQQEKLAQTQSLKKSLMQDLLTGKVRVTVN